jgi:hypothetical protein
VAKFETITKLFCGVSVTYYLDGSVEICYLPNKVAIASREITKAKAAGLLQQPTIRKNGDLCILMVPPDGCAK